MEKVIRLSEQEFKDVLITSLSECISKLPFFYEGTQNKSLPIPLTETNAKRVIDRHSSNGYIIISTCRGGSDFGLDTGNPNDAETLKHINNERTKTLLNDVQTAGFSYTPCYGGFIENKGLDNEDTVYEQSWCNGLN